MSTQKNQIKRSRTGGGGEILSIVARPRVFKRFLIVKPTTEGDSFETVSPFALLKEITAVVSSRMDGCKKLRDGSLLLEAATAVQSLKMLECTMLCGKLVKVEPHGVLNYVKGVISCYDLLHCNDEECREELKCEGVVEVRRLQIRRNGESRASTSMVLTFEGDKLPEFVNVGYNRCKVRPFYPAPMRCYGCQAFGHTAIRCNKNKVCGRCAGAAHEGDCSSPACCVNCEGEHFSFSRDCPVMQEERRIVEIKISEKISYAEARRKVKTLPPLLVNTFAAVTRQSFINTNNKSTNSLSSLNRIKPQDARRASSPKKSAASEAAKPASGEAVATVTATPMATPAAPAAGTSAAAPSDGTAAQNTPPGVEDTSSPENVVPMEVVEAEPPQGVGKQKQPPGKFNGRGRSKSPIKFK